MSKQSKKTTKTTKTHHNTSAKASADRNADRRLPAIGTVIQKLDRNGNLRCKCKVEKQGIRYNGTVYRSLSGAAMAAASDLGLESTTQNGFVFWALS